MFDSPDGSTTWTKRYFYSTPLSPFFDTSCLCVKLRNFANAARQLGSSVAILSSAFHLRERLALLLFLYHENAADLFPRKIAHIVKETPADFQIKRVRGKARLHVPRPTVPENVDPESFPEQLEFLAKEVTTFLRCLNEFPEFTDEAVNASILSFEGDLKVLIAAQSLEQTSLTNF